MKKIALISALLAVSARAAPFLTADPYPPTGPQPDVFLVTVGTAAPVSVPAIKEGDGDVMLKWDLAGVGTGQKTITVKAKNAWGESALSAPFTFIPGAAAAPAKIGISAQ